ncbi:uncharacterized protein KY384_002608 [Bacidia gigantensis]|uniref:uncharacterized protein n=1 Tax=Bacidia gigantensis TaxID=2732470 RepID=UPI001D0517A9|nr:uncharacterized protein KY384_002608 [Bacidia gigantensis]KAG8532731.1 hypothetical protein KY384_002608 [Bacidia gigantensis]
MGCFGDREKFGSATNEQRWDFINLSDFKSTSCWSGFSYGVVYFFLIISFGVYIVDLYTASNLLFFNRWSSQVQPKIPFEISKWVFAGCIFLSWILLIYRWWRAIRAIKSGLITASYLDPLAVRIESIRPGKARGWRRFLVFTALTKGRKGSEYVALFTYYNFEAWLRVVFAEGPRQVINAITLYSVLKADLIPEGKHAATKGQSPVGQFFDNIRILANQSTQQATILFGMLYVLIIWLFTAVSLFIAFVMYITFLWHHIPSADGSLSNFCQRKIEKRLNQIVRAKMDKAIAKEHLDRVKKVATGGTGASVGLPTVPPMDYKRQPTIPNLESDTAGLPAPPSRQTTSNLGSRPASPFGARSISQRAPTIPDVSRGSSRPGFPSRNATQSSFNSLASHGSDAPLLGSAAEMGHAPPNRHSPPGGPPSIRSNQSFNNNRGPLQPRRGPTPRLNTGMSGRSVTPSAPSSAGASFMSRDPSTASPGPNQRPPGHTNFSRRPTQEFEMQPPTPSDGKPSSGYVAFNPLQRPSQSNTPNQPHRPPPADYFGAQHVPRRVGTAPVQPPSAGYDDSIYDAYGAQNSPPFRPATAGPGPTPGGGNNGWHGPGGRGAYNPPRF